MLVIIGGFVYWFGYSLLFYIISFLIFILIGLKVYYYYFFLSFFLPFLLGQVAERVLVLWPGVRPEALIWES